MTTPVAAGSSGSAAKAAKRVPSLDSSTRSSCETDAPARTGIGGSESGSKHIPWRTLLRADGLFEEDTSKAVLTAAAGLHVAERGIEGEVLCHQLVRVEPDLRK